MRKQREQQEITKQLTLIAKLYAKIDKLTVEKAELKKKNKRLLKWLNYSRGCIIYGTDYDKITKAIEDNM